MANFDRRYNFLEYKSKICIYAGQEI